MTGGVIESLFIYTEACQSSPLFIVISCKEALCQHLQPVMWTAGTLLSVHALYVEFVSEVESDSKSGLHRDDVLAGQKRR